MASLVFGAKPISEPMLNVYFWKIATDLYAKHGPRLSERGLIFIYNVYACIFTNPSECGDHMLMRMANKLAEQVQKVTNLFNLEKYPF